MINIQKSLPYLYSTKAEGKRFKVDLMSHLKKGEG